MTDNNPFTRTVHFFDKLEDHIRARLSRTPILYAFIGGIGIVLFWRGIWHIADHFEGPGGVISLIIGSLILLLTGAFVSTLIGNRIILTGLRGEKKLAEKTKEEIDAEESELKNIQKTLIKVEEHLQAIEKELPRNHGKK